MPCPLSSDIYDFLRLMSGAGIYDQILQGQVGGAGGVLGWKLSPPRIWRWVDVDKKYQNYYWPSDLPSSIAWESLLVASRSWLKLILAAILD